MHDNQDTSPDQAIARSRAYRLFGELFLASPSRPARSALVKIPELAAQMVADPEAAAADHYQLFGLNVFPYQSAFMEPSGTLGGEVTDQVQAFFHQAGFSPDRLSSESLDHAGMELLLLSQLCALEAEAWEHGISYQAIQAVHFQRQLLNRFLLPWFPGFVQAIRSHGHPFYTVLGELCLELLIDHHRSLPLDRIESDIDIALPPVPDLLENPKTGLKEIATFLLTPAYSGIYLSREDINRLARPLRLPHGFGPRQQTLTNLMQTAADFDLLPDLFKAILEKVGEWEKAYRQVYNQAPGSGKIMEAWLERLQTTSCLLQSISAGALSRSLPPVPEHKGDDLGESVKR